MALLELLNRLIVEHGSSQILREHLSLLKTQAESLMKEKAALQDENARLNQRVAELQKQLLAQSRADEFVEERGALFKRKSNGGYHEAVFCPGCHGPMSSTQQMLNFRCGKCGVIVNFNGNRLAAILKELP